MNRMQMLLSIMTVIIGIKSTNAVTFKDANTDLPNKVSTYINGIEKSANGDLFIIINSSASDSLGIFKSIDQGDSWTNVKAEGLPITGKTDICISQNKIFISAGYQKATLWVSEDGGLTFKDSNTGLPNKVATYINGIAKADNGDLFVIINSSVSDSLGIFKSIDQGKTWEHVKADGLPMSGRTDICISSDKMFISAGYQKATLWVSEDGGQTFNDSNTGLPNKSSTYINGIAKADNADLFVIVNSHVSDSLGLFKSIDQGNSWTKVNTDGLPLVGRTDICISSDKMFISAGYQKATLWASQDYESIINPSNIKKESAINVTQSSNAINISGKSLTMVTVYSLIGKKLLHQYSYSQKEVIINHTLATGAYVLEVDNMKQRLWVK